MTIAELRKNEKLTQDVASKALKISKNYLSKIETGKRNPSDKLKRKMAHLYRTTVVEIYNSLPNNF